MNNKPTLNWVRFFRMILLWVSFYILIKFGLSWFPAKGFWFKSYSISKEVFIEFLFILLAAKSFNMICRIFIWDYITPRMLKCRAPQMLVQSIAFAVYFVSLLIIISMIFGKSIVGFLTTLGGIGVIIGFGIQRLVLDAFSGISINVDSSFKIGDFIKISTNNNIFMGQVTKISWRLTTILTPEDSEISIPNSVVSGNAIVNFSKPTPCSEFEQIYNFSPNADDKLIQTILTNAALSVVEMGYIEKDTIPKIRISKIAHNEGVACKVKYMVNPVKNGPGKVKHFLHNAVLRHAKACGLKFYDSNEAHTAPEIRLINHKEIGEQTNPKIQLLKIVPIFGTLTNEESQFLISNMIIHSFPAETAIAEQGEKGNSMYIIERGFVSIHVKNKDGKNSVVGILNPGDFFGEMSLLTGKKRNATILSKTEVIVYEITKEAILNLVNKNPSLYEKFAKILANRELSTKEHLKKSEEIQLDRKNLVDELLGKIKSYLSWQ